MNPLNRRWFYRGFRKRLAASLGKHAADEIWDDAGREYRHILASRPELKRHKGAMTLPAVALYRTLRPKGKTPKAS